jgi:hypothetical protein
VELEEFGIKQGRAEEAFEEGQGLCRAVEPMMMMMMMMMVMMVVVVVVVVDV